MKPSPCLRPVRVFNKTLGEYLYVPCGHCEACLVSKGFSRSQRLAKDLENYRFLYFVTLTYDDYHLPLAQFDGDEHFVHPFDCDYDGVVKSLHVGNVRSDDWIFYRDCVSRFGGLPVLSHSDVIKFKKRFRYYLKTLCSKFELPYESVYIYICGEYGSTTFRPHYHCLFGFNERRITGIFGECVNYAWRFPERNNTTERFVSRPIGAIDIQAVVDRNCYTYVAQYLSCVTQLPNILQHGCFRPFAQSSKVTVAGINYKDVPLLSEFVSKLPCELSVSKPSSTERVSVPVPTSIENRYFPKFVGFKQVPRCLCYRIYSCAIHFLGLSTEVVCSLVLDAFKNGFLDDDFNILKQLYYDSTDIFKTKAAIRRWFYSARRVCRNAFTLGLSVYDYTLRLLEYYDKKELYKLRRFYQLQVDMLTDVYNPCTLSQLFSLYYDTGDIKNLDFYISQFGANAKSGLSSISLQNNYISVMRKIIGDTTKTKKRNSYFASKGWKRPAYIPYINKKLLRL